MKNNHLFMFSINEVYNFLKDLMEIDIYDRSTIEWFSRNHLKKVSLDELYKMEETVLIDINKSSRINSTFWASLSVVMAVFIGTYAILISLYSELEVDFGSGIILILFILIALFGVVTFAFNHEQLFGKKRNRLHDLLRILIHLKENAQNT